MTTVQETILLQGHIIDTPILAKVLDCILMRGGTFDLETVEIGRTRDDPSQARIVVRAPTIVAMNEILCAIQSQGAVMERQADCRYLPSPADGVFPEEFYTTTHLPTQIRLNGSWIDVDGIEMDVGICVDIPRRTARAMPMGAVRRGDLIIVGQAGVRVTPLQRPRERDVFSFMAAAVSAERPHGHIIADVAQRMRTLREQQRTGGSGSKILLAGGPAIIHAGGRDALTWLIEEGYVQVLFCGNALAAHDMEADLYGTSLGYALEAGHAVPHGHAHHLWTINRIRAIGSIRAAVESGVIKKGIMASCIRRGVAVVMAGTIRDDGPVPGVMTDSMKAQTAMREAIHGVGLALLVASTLHAVATGNLLPATIPTVCVDINASVPTKLADRGSYQAVGLVMDAASFLNELARHLGRSA